MHGKKKKQRRNYAFIFLEFYVIARIKPPHNFNLMYAFISALSADGIPHTMLSVATTAVD